MKTGKNSCKKAKITPEREGRDPTMVCAYRYV